MHTSKPGRLCNALMLRVGVFALFFVNSILLAQVNIAMTDTGTTSDLDGSNIPSANPQPEYPKESISNREAGTVVLRVLLTVDGRVEQLEVDTSSGFPRLDSAAMEAVKRWRFNPPVASQQESKRLLVPITFTHVDDDTTQLLSEDAAKQDLIDPNWTSDQSGCRLYDYGMRPDTQHLWKGACVNRLIEGPGVVQLLRDGVVIGEIAGVYHAGKLEGLASVQSSDHGSYHGNFLHGLKHGKGVQIWKNGARYEGEFIRHSLTGHAVLSWPNGVRYEGKVEKGLPVEARFELPQRLSSNKLRFPNDFADYYATGVVNLEVDLSDQGTVEAVEVLQSDHPAFEKEALRALVLTAFSPAKINGQTIPYTFRQRFVFGSKGDVFKPYGVGFDEDVNAGKQKTQSRPDRLPTFKVIAPLVYPHDLLLQDTTGEASAEVVIDPNGWPSEIKIKSASHPAFAHAMQAMLASSSFNPAIKDKVAIWSKLSIARTFSRASGHVPFEKNMLRLLAKIKNNNKDVFKLADLDRKVRAIFRPAPIISHHTNLNQDENVLLSFYIDKTGHVQLPKVLKANNPDLGWLALTAVSRWQFEPPTVKGETVDVLVNMPVVFAAPQSATD